MMNKISIFSIRIDSVLLTFPFALSSNIAGTDPNFNILYFVSHSSHTSPNPGSEKQKQGREAGVQ